MDVSEEAVELLGELIGPEAAGRFAGGGRDYERRLRQAVVEMGYGHVWGSSILSRRDRMLITVAVLAATGRTAELDLHIGVALGQDVAPAELAETFLQTALYAGFPAALEGTAALRRGMEAR